MRTVTRWGVFLVCLLVCGSVLFGTHAEARSGSKSWVVSALPGGSDWAYSWAWDVSDSGYIVGYWAGEDWAVHPVYWLKGEYHDITDEIGLPGDNTNGNLFTVNSAGLAGGATWGGITGQVATLWDLSEGTVADIHPYGLDEGLVASYINGLNASGDVVGAVVLPVGETYGTQPFFWPKGDPDGGVLLPLGEFVHADAWNINSSGTITGYAEDVTGNMHAVVWAPVAGEYEIVDLLPEMESAGVLASWGYDVTESGVVVGLAMIDEVAENGFNMSRGFTWSAEKGLKLLDEGGYEFAAAWKAVGNLVTGGIGLSPSFYANRAGVWEKGRLEILPLMSGRGYLSSNSINKNGVVVGVAYDDEGAGPVGTWAFVAEKR